jgi:hypothetical protein
MTATYVWMFWHIQGEVFSSKYLKNQKCTSLENVREFSFVFLSSLQTNFGQLKVSTSWVHLQYASQAETNLDFHLNGICRWKSQKMSFFFPKFSSQIYLTRFKTWVPYTPSPMVALRTQWSDCIFALLTLRAEWKGLSWRFNTSIRRNATQGNTGCNFVIKIQFYCSVQCRWIKRFFSGSSLTSQYFVQWPPQKWQFLVHKCERFWKNRYSSCFEDDKFER